ncbi:MAG: antibiotic biosynthesis monooxygenase [Actinobacteria bacterium]|nr:antibiotic biosynthesis monooxygenase [Actinomycetota bacterium]MBV8562860.1 antibiotic biosynthesis monooxygenase [Actinomycetota bacterium]
MSFVLVVRMRAQEGKEEEVAEVIRELTEATRQEPGNEAYIPCRSHEDPRSFLFYEQYVDKAAFEAHGQSEHFQRLAVGRLWGLLEGDRERGFYDTLV